MMNKLTFFLVFAGFTLGAFFAQQAGAAPLESLISSSHAAQLRSGGESVSVVQLKSPSVKLMPNHAQLKQFVSGAMNSLGPNVLVETLYLYEKPASSGSWDERQQTGLFNQIVSLSTLSGIEYYSASRKAMRTFYESSAVIDGPDSKKPVPDPVFAVPPASLSIYARQKDLTFGDNIYRYDFKTAPDAFFFMQENMTAMIAGIIPAVGKNKLRSILAVIDCGDSLLIYAVSMTKVTSVFGMGDRISASFGNRAEAVLKWFTIRADKVFTGK